MTGKRAWMRFFMGELQLFGLLHTVLAVVLCALYPGLLASSLLLLVPALAMGLARALLPNALLLVLGHLALAAWPVLLPLAFRPRLAATLFLALLALASLYKRLAAERSERMNRENYSGDNAEQYRHIRGDGPAYSFSFSSVLLMGLFNLALSLIASRLGIQGANAWLLGWALVALACGLAVRQTEAVDDELAHLAKSTRQPVRQILRMDNTLLVILLTLVTVAMVLAITLPLEGVLAAIASALYTALVVILRFIAGLFGGERQPPQPPAEGPVAQAASPLLPIEPPGETPWLITLLGILFGVAACLVATAAVLYGLYRLYRRFHGTQTFRDTDEREFILPAFQAMPLGSLLSQLRARLPSFGSGEQARVRRRYYRTVRRHIRRGAKISPTQTAGEIETSLAPQEDIHVLTAQYNLARYNKPDGKARR